MTILKGERVDLDALLGFSRLQEVLTKLIEHMNENDEKVGNMITENARNQIAQDAAIKKMKEDVEAALKKLDSQDAVVKGKLTDMDKKVDQACKDVKAETEDRKNEAKKILTELGLLQTKQKEFPTRFEAIEKQFSPMKLRIDACEEELARLGQDSKKMDEIVGDLAKVKAVAQSAEDGVKEVSKKFAPLEEELAKLNENIEAAKKESKAAIEAAIPPILEEVKKLEASLLEKQEELKKVIDEKDVENKTEIQKVDEALKALAASLNVRAQIDALRKKLNEEIQALRDELGPLQEAIKSMGDSGSSATVRCLSCSTKRPTVGSSFTVGTDGRTYFRTGDGNNVNLGRINLPSLQGNGQNRSISPSLGRSMSPKRTMSPPKSRGMPRMNASHSAGHI